jgi:hypothetical protein
MTKYLKLSFPFLLTLLLWRLSVPFWNPVGILALIPIFFYSFIRPHAWFAPFAALMCFLIDYRCDTLLILTSIYCFVYAINGFQNFVDLTQRRNNGIFVFMGFAGAIILILAFSGFSFNGAIHAVWMWVWLVLFYTPIIRIWKND